MRKDCLKEYLIQTVVACIDFKKVLHQSSVSTDIESKQDTMLVFRDPSFIMSGGGGGFRGGVQFSKSLERGGYIFTHSTCGRAYIFLRLVFSKSGVTDISICSTSNITQKMA